MRPITKFTDIAKNIRVLNKLTSEYGINFYVLITDNHLHLNCLCDGKNINDIMKTYHCNNDSFCESIRILKNQILYFEACLLSGTKIKRSIKYFKLWKALKERKLLTL